MLGFAFGLKINKYESEGWCRGHSHTPRTLTQITVLTCLLPPTQPSGAIFQRLFIIEKCIEMLKAYSVAEVIHHHLQQALVCVRPTGLTVSTS